MNGLALVGTVAGAHLLAAISPGPDFLMAVRNSLVYSRRTGIWTAVGFGCGIAAHIAGSLAGLALLISRSILIFNAIKLLGALYLVYIGLRTFFSRSSALEIGEHGRRQDISPLAAVRIGFLTNVLNPKASLFILSLFTLVISPDTPWPLLGLLSLILVGDTILWFTLVAVFMTQERVRKTFTRYQGVFNRILGGLLVALGVVVALTGRD